MIDLVLVGIGMGNPDHLTGQAIKALQNADLILIPEKGNEKSDLADLRAVICEKLLSPIPQIARFRLPVRDPKESSYLKRVTDWHEKIALLWRDEIFKHCPNGGRVALMIWGDPSLYDSSLRIANRLIAEEQKVSINVVPGLTSVQLLTAAHKIPLNTLAEPVMIMTGRNLRDGGWPNTVKTVVVMLDGDCSFDQLDGKDYTIWWGAFLGMPEQILASGPLHQCCEDIKVLRANARAEHGWIMDSYLLRKNPI
ncbi:precorrin-6A synthase (deacetylating) [Rhodobacteraceae bacterium]|nr:precorrin-6A synthase (deacetylating) [Paracoccaceae bacterium]|tara:strand:- start:3267 stop:4025 length:759 start_codon:yes stop_codon:yes gene_type:complete